jgi:hypothetical protein
MRLASVEAAARFYGYRELVMVAWAGRELIDPGAPEVTR